MCRESLRAKCSSRFKPRRSSQADSSSIRIHGGLGVGLAIVRYIVELHGGHVTVESRGKGHGSTFTVMLPATMAETSTKTGKSKRTAEALSSLKGVRVLIV